MKNFIKRDCIYYGWGDGVYPRELGARCRKKKEWMTLTLCKDCKFYFKDRRLEKDRRKET